MKQELIFDNIHKLMDYFLFYSCEENKYVFSKRKYFFHLTEMPFKRLNSLNGIEHLHFKGLTIDERYVPNDQLKEVEIINNSNLNEIQFNNIIQFNSIILLF